MMELFWYGLIIVFLCGYFVLDGYDFGTGIIHLFFAKTEEDKVLVAKAAGLFWDSNEVWLVVVGGLVFMAFPTLYASAFSGFYLPLMIVLWLIIFRAIGLELRGQFHHAIWTTIWDRAFGISSLLLALFFGIALGNVVRGVNLGGVVGDTVNYEPQYFFLPLWNQYFSPLAERPGIIDWFTVFIGIISVVVLAIHGANWIRLKTNSSINVRLKAVVFRLSIVLSILTVASIIVWLQVNPDALTQFMNKPMMNIFPAIYLIGLIGTFLSYKSEKDFRAFVFSSLMIIGGITSSFASIFPVVLPSTNNMHDSLTIYNTAADSYSLTVSLYWGAIALVLLVFYILVQRKLLKGKIDDIEYGH